MKKQTSDVISRGMKGDDVFSKTLSGLNSGLTLRTISTFELMTCSFDARVDEVWASESCEGFDQIPVKKNDRIIGVIKRTEVERSENSCAEEVMTQLSEIILSSLDTPILAFMENYTGFQYSLVEGENGICGIVTRSDLLKLPVRVLAFSVIAQLELVMADAIRRNCSSEECWLSKLNSSERKRIRGMQEIQQKDNIDLDLLELTSLKDKAKILEKIRLDLFNVSDEDMMAIMRIRNSVAHASTFARNDEELVGFVSGVLCAKRLIEVISEQLPG